MDVLARPARSRAGPSRPAVGGRTRRRRGRRSGGIRPLLAVAAPGGRRGRVPLRLRQALRPGLAARPAAAVPAGAGGGPPGGRAVVRRGAGAGRTRGRPRVRPARPARGPARSAGHENLGRPVVPPDCRGARGPGQHRRVPLPLRPGQAPRTTDRGADPMNEADDPLEAELAALRPRDVSPALRRRVAERLADPPPEKLRRLWWLALAGGLAAAGLAAAVLFWWGSGPGVEPERFVQPQPEPPVEDWRPPFPAYRLALVRSPEELDALLEKHSPTAPEPNPELVGICAFTRSPTTLHALLGEP